jgi:putative transcriptional regulator
MKRTPGAARRYFLLAAFLLVLPTLSSLYKGHTGKLLISGNLIDQGPFYESVVYIVDHELFGAYGFIINKPLEDDVQAAKTDIKLPLFYGGPVEYPKWQRIAAWLSGKKIVLEHLPYEEKDGQSQQFVVFGYAGWGPLQLDFEVARGAWMVMDFDYSLVYETDPEDIWDLAVAKYRAKHPPEPEKMI